MVTAQILCFGTFFSGGNVEIHTFCTITLNSGKLSG